VGVVVDTSELIEIERRSPNGDFDVTELSGDAYIAAITVGELELGILLSTSSRMRELRERFFARINETVPVIPFGEAEAREWARIYAELRSSGMMIGERDLQIAATAIAGGHRVLTRNAGEFGRVSGLEVITIDQQGAV